MNKNIIIGYARVSTKDQNLDMQINALNKAGCTKIFTEKISSTKTVRPELEKALNLLREGDILVVYKLDRLGRSLVDLLNIVNSLKNKGVDFKCIKDGFIDTCSPMGRLLFSFFGALSEFERAILVDRTNEGLEAARRKGKIGGRRKGLSKENKRKATIAAQLYLNGDMLVRDICTTLHIGSKATCYRYLKYKGIELKRNNRENKINTKTAN